MVWSPGWTFHECTTGSTAEASDTKGFGPIPASITFASIVGCPVERALIARCLPSWMKKCPDTTAQHGWDLQSVARPRRVRGTDARGSDRGRAGQHVCGHHGGGPIVPVQSLQGPFPHPASLSNVSLDDIPAVIAFGPGKVGVMWNRQDGASTDGMYRFTLRGTQGSPSFCVGLVSASWGGFGPEGLHRLPPPTLMGRNSLTSRWFSGHLGETCILDDGVHETA